jgi:hypothetical protein
MAVVEPPTNKHVMLSWDSSLQDVAGMGKHLRYLHANTKLIYHNIWGLDPHFKGYVS